MPEPVAVTPPPSARRAVLAQERGEPCPETVGAVLAGNPGAAAQLRAVHRFAESRGGDEVDHPVGVLARDRASRRHCREAPLVQRIGNLAQDHRAVALAAAGIFEGEPGKSLREAARAEGVSDEILDKALDYRAMARPHG